MVSKTGTLMIISGPSGVGKGTVVKKILESNSNVKLSVSATTRKKRLGEVDGVDYHFYSKEDFLKLCENGEMLEYAEYCGNFYGTPSKPIENWLKIGKDVLLEIEIKGAKKIKKKCKDCVAVFLLPPSLDVLYNRLKGRGTEDEMAVQCRLERAKEELRCADFYDYLVVNTEVEKGASDILSILKAEKLKFSNMNSFLKEVLDSDCGY